MEGLGRPFMREIKPLSFTYEIPNALAPDLCREMIVRSALRIPHSAPVR